MASGRFCKANSNYLRLAWEKRSTKRNRRFAWMLKTMHYVHHRSFIAYSILNIDPKMSQNSQKCSLSSWTFVRRLAFSLFLTSLISAIFIRCTFKTHSVPFRSSSSFGYSSTLIFIRFHFWTHHHFMSCNFHVFQFIIESHDSLNARPKPCIVWERTVQLQYFLSTTKAMA